MWAFPFLLGGYYQSRSGQVSKDMFGIGCELCTNGTFVSPDEAPGLSTADCKVCPMGTDGNKFAGFRACPCLKGYYRKNRFGPCMPCPQEGINCTKEYQKLMPGFWWTWTFVSGSQHASKRYKEFVANLKIHDRSYESTSTEFIGSLPKPFPCLRGEVSCPESNGIDEACGLGYEGWLCSHCSIGYYSWFEYCVKCPPICIWF